MIVQPVLTSRDMSRDHRERLKRLLPKPSLNMNEIARAID
jgi:hypothetical protein